MADYASTIFIACLVGAVISFVFMIWYFSELLSNTKPGKEKWLHWLGPVIFFMPPLFNAEGNRARIKLILVTIILVGIILFVIYVIPPARD